jgi:hypothetical protein
MKYRIMTAALLTSLATSTVLAADKPKDALPSIAKCASSYGTIALADGESQGWTEFGLGSPRELLAALVAESGCFSMHSPESGLPATFLMSAAVGSTEAIDPTVNAVKAGATEGLVRSGALGKMGGFGGMGGKALGMLGGLGGKKKTVAAGLRVLSPATGQTLVFGSAESVKSSITLGGSGGWGFANSAASGVNQYTGSKDGLQLTTAFIKAFNAVTAQGGVLASVPKVIAPVQVAAAALPKVSTAIATQLYAQPTKGTVLRALRAGTELAPTGKREGLFAEVKDNFGTSGWVSVEDMK